MRHGYLVALAALVAPILAGCTNDRPYPVANTAFYSDLPPLPPPNYGAATAPAPSRSVRRSAYHPRATGLTDDQIRIRILQAAVTACVPGAPCVCPDVTPDMIAAWRRDHGG